MNPLVVVLYDNDKKKTLKPRKSEGGTGRRHMGTGTTGTFDTSSLPTVGNDMEATHHPLGWVADDSDITESHSDDTGTSANGGMQPETDDADGQTDFHENTSKTSPDGSVERHATVERITIPIADGHDQSLFVHLADLHLAPRGSAILKRDSKSGRLVRDLDYDRALTNAVDDILAQSPLPAAVVIAGDIFDTFKGSPDAFLTVIRQIRRVVASGIAVIGIAGNHDTPTNQLKTSMFEMLKDAFAGEPLVALAYDTVIHASVGNTEFVLLPHRVCLTGTFAKSDLEPSDPSCDRSVLVVHGVAAGDPSLQQMDEAKEIPIARWILDMPWRYVAFGHFHKPGWIHGYVGKAAYCGSLENTVVSGPDVCMRRGPVYVNLDGMGEGMCEMHEQPIRQIVTLSPLDVRELGEGITPSGLDDEIGHRIADNPIHEAIVLLKVTNVTRSLYKALPRRGFQQCDDTALFVRVTFEFAAEQGAYGPSDKLQRDSGTNDEPMLDEDGNPIADADDDAIDAGSNGQQVLLPLDKEAELALDALIANGTLSSSIRNGVLDELRSLLAETQQQ